MYFPTKKSSLFFIFASSLVGEAFFKMSGTCIEACVTRTGVDWVPGEKEIVLVLAIIYAISKIMSTGAVIHFL